MHSIQGFVGQLGDRVEGRPVRPAADACLGALEGLGALAEDVLAMAGASRPRLERVAVQDVVRSALVLLGHPPLHLCLPESGVDVEVHRSQLVHAVFNLLDNAVRMNPPGDAVSVRLAVRDARVVLEITDAGPGLPQELAQARGPLPSRTGSGLGLMAARRFVEACGGTLAIGAGPDGGTQCRLEFPAATVSSLRRAGS